MIIYWQPIGISDLEKCWKNWESKIAVRFNTTSTPKLNKKVVVKDTEHL